MKTIEISRTLFATILILTIGLSTSATAFVLTLPDSHHQPTRWSANVFYHFETLGAGDIYGGSGNVITNIGERYARNILGFDNVTANNATEYISLGNATAGVALTKLTTEATTTGFDRATGSVVAWNNGTDHAYNITNQFTATGTIRVDATGLHWNPTDDSDDNMFSCADITATTFENNDNCTIVWVITCDGN